jgi:hypothetical protein
MYLTWLFWNELRSITFQSSTFFPVTFPLNSPIRKPSTPNFSLHGLILTAVLDAIRGVLDAFSTRSGT